MSFSNNSRYEGRSDNSRGSFGGDRGSRGGSFGGARTGGYAPRNEGYSPRPSNYAPRSEGYAPRSGGYESRAPRAEYSPRPSFGGYQDRSARPSFGGSRFGGGSRGGFGGARKMSFRGKTRIDERMFINKATETTEIESYVAKHVFADFAIAPILAANLAKKNFVKPSPIQDQAIPVALTGQDIIGIAATGTGKTAAFLLPILNKLVADRKHKAMILAPTRELALQVDKELRELALGMQFYTCSAVGGMPIYNQMRSLERGVSIVVGTPGRVQDLIKRGKIRMNEFKTIVLDEADRMLDMGFIDDMRAILGAMPEDKQGMFFSATFEPKVKALCSDFLRNPVTVMVKTRDTSGSVEQNIVRIERGRKTDQLHEILQGEDAKKVLIFREMKRSVDELVTELKGRGVKVSGLHGDMHNRERVRAVDALKAGSVQVLIATDVAARGIHIDDVSHVINFDLPNDYETYVHRIGRTGRGGARGMALTFVN